MAKIISPLGGTEVRGSIGGLTYSRCRSGLYVRAKGSLLRTRTPDQMTMRAAFAACSAYYLTLTLEEMDAWDEFARLYPFHVPGLSMMRLCSMTWFKRANVHRRIVGFPWVRRPPKTPAPTYTGKFWLYRTGKGVLGNVSPGPTGQQITYMSRGIRPHAWRRTTPEKWRKVGYGTETSPPPKMIWEYQVQGKIAGNIVGRARLIDENGMFGPWIDKIFPILPPGM